MADYLRDELGKLLNQYDEHRRAVAAREQKVKDDDALFVASFAELRRGIIRPAFETAGAMLAERGHKVTIAEQEFSVDAAAKVTEAEISLRIVPSGAKEGNARTLSISTRHYNKTVLINAGKPVEGVKGTYPLEKIDQHRVEEELVRFVAGIVAG
jgi:DNA replication initiation complex subunit (GINS family)